MINDIKIYQEYILSKSTDTNVAEVAKKFGVSRTCVYDVVERVENGNEKKIRQCNESARLDCLWKYRYSPRYATMPKNQKSATLKAHQELIREMLQDEFPQLRIAKLLGKGRSTIIRHLEKLSTG